MNARPHDRDRRGHAAIAPAPVPGRRAARAAGFTLVEILIVVIILGILAALVMPKFTSASQESKAAAAAAICRNVQQKVLEYRSTHGQYPDDIDPTWFAGKALPKSPFDPTHETPIEYDTASPESVRHPRFKFTNASTAPFWYNPANGMFRARVTAQATTAKTLELYNKANAAKVATYFGQTD